MEDLHLVEVILLLGVFLGRKDAGEEQNEVRGEFLESNGEALQERGESI